jgi:hypothetical protein
LDNQNPKDDEVIQVTLPKPRSQKPKHTSNKNASEKNPPQPFSYSVSYFAWALSDSEDEDVQCITLPLRNMSLEKSGGRQAKSKTNAVKKF